MSGLVHSLTMRSPTALPVTLRGRQCGGCDPGQSILSTSRVFDRLGCVPGDPVIVLQRKGDSAWEVYFGRASLQAVTEEDHDTASRTRRGDIPEVWTTARVTQTVEEEDAHRLSSWLSAEHGCWVAPIAAIMGSTPCARVDLAQRTPEPLLPPEACHAACYGWLMAPRAKLHLPSISDPIEISSVVPDRPVVYVGENTAFLWVRPSEEGSDDANVGAGTPRTSRRSPLAVSPEEVRTPERGPFNFADFIHSPATPSSVASRSPSASPAKAPRHPDVPGPNDPWPLTRASVVRLPGLEGPLARLRVTILLPLVRPHWFHAVGVATAGALPGTLLHGPHGTGKSSLIHAIATEAAQLGAVVRVFSVTCGGLESPEVGASERRLVRAWRAARRFAKSGNRQALCDDANSRRETVPRVRETVIDSVGAAAVKEYWSDLSLRDDDGDVPRISLFVLDAIDAWAANDEEDASRSSWQTRVAATLSSLLEARSGRSNDVFASDSEDEKEDREGGVDKGMLPFTVLATALRQDAVRESLTRAGRLDRSIRVDPPGVDARAEILRWYATAVSAKSAEAVGVEVEDTEWADVAQQCVGYTGADLCGLIREAWRIAKSPLAASEATHRDWRTKLAEIRQRQSSSALPQGDESCASGDVVLRAEHLARARARILASALRGLTTAVPPVTWDDVGGLEEVKQRLQQAVEWPLRYRSAFQVMRLSPPRGVLLFGPPGCAKTLLVRAAARTASASFFSLSGADIYSKYVGEAERTLRELFARAREAAPAVVFLDEIDALVGDRSHGQGAGAGGGGAAAGVLATLLTEMDGVEQAEGVLVVGATNQPELLDAALLRPGRFEVRLLIPPPDRQARQSILEIHSRRSPLGEDVSLSDLAAQTDGFTGAEVAALCREAGMAALRESLEAEAVCARHFAVALRAVRPLFGGASDGQRRLAREMDRLCKFAHGEVRGHGIVSMPKPGGTFQSGMARSPSDAFATAAKHSPFAKPPTS